MPEQYPKGKNPEEELLKGVEKLSESARFFSEIEHFALEEGRAENSMVSVYRGEHLVAKALTSPKFGGSAEALGVKATINDPNSISATNPSYLEFEFAPEREGKRSQFATSLDIVTKDGERIRKGEPEEEDWIALQEAIEAERDLLSSRVEEQLAQKNEVAKIAPETGNRNEAFAQSFRGRLGATATAAVKIYKGFSSKASSTGAGWASKLRQRLPNVFH